MLQAFELFIIIAVTGIIAAVIDLGVLMILAKMSSKKKVN
jgi:hypothetical protein